MNARPARRVSGTAAPAPVPAKLKTLAKDFYTQNADANKLVSKSKKTRKELFVGMQDAKLKDFTTGATVDGKIMTLEVKIEAAERSVIDVEKLSKLVPLADLLKMVSASIESVEEVAGKVIAAQCTTTVKGNLNVSVKPAK